MDIRLDKSEVSLLQLINVLSIEENVLYAEQKQELRTGSIKMNLPVIPLPVFSGNYEDWGKFKTSATNLIASNVELSDSQKLHYLTASLQGKAKSIETEDDTYDSFFNALQQRYENRRVIIDTHIKNILRYPRMNNESAKELRDFVDNIKKNLRALKVLEYERDKLSDILLVNVLIEKLDLESRKQFEMSISSNNVPLFDDFITFLEKQSHILESISRNISGGKSINKSTSQFFPNNRSKSLVINANSSFDICVACKKKEKHSLFNCTIFRSL